MNSILKPIAALLEKNDEVKSLSFRNMGLGVMPVDLTRFPKLEHLDLTGNQFVVLPAQLAQLKNLKSINLSSNFRLNWSKSLLVLLECRKLELLNISYNGLNELPAEFHHLDQLKKLVIDGNKFDAFSDRTLMNMPVNIECINACDCPSGTFSNRISQFESLKRVVVDGFEFDELMQLHWRNPKVDVILI